MLQKSSPAPSFDTHAVIFALFDFMFKLSLLLFLVIDISHLLANDLSDLHSKGRWSAHAHMCMPLAKGNI